MGYTRTEEMPPANVAPTTSRDLLPCRSLGPLLQGGERRAGWSIPARAERVERILDRNMGLSQSFKGGLGL